MTRTIGARRLSVVDKQGTDFPLLVMYPSLDPSATVSIGPYQLDVAEDGCIEPGRFPLVLISHGSGGTHLWSAMACPRAPNLSIESLRAPGISPS